MKKIIYILLINLLLLTNLSASSNADRCDDLTKNSLSNPSSTTHSRPVKNSDGIITCRIDNDFDKDNNCKIVSKAFKLKSGNQYEPSSYTCVDFFVVPENKNTTVYIKGQIEKHKTLITSKLEIVKDVNEDTSTAPLDDREILKEIDKQNRNMSELADKANDKLKNQNPANDDDKAKSSFFTNFLSENIYNPSDAFSMEKLKNPMNVKFEPKTYQANTIFQECAEKKQKIPTFKLFDILNVIKDTVFDLEGQIENMVTGIVKNISDSLLDLTSDEAVLTYTIQAFSKIVAVAICKFRDSTLGNVQQSLQEESCKDAHDTDSESTQSNTDVTTGCWTEVFWTCLFSFMDGITFGATGMELQSQETDQTACEKEAESTREQTYEECTETEPEKVREHILGILNMQVKAGDIEIGTVAKCRENELQERFSNRNVYDASGNPHRNRVTDFLNKGVDYLQEEVRDVALGYVKKSLDNISLEARALRAKRNVNDLLDEVVKEGFSMNLKDLYPSIDESVLVDYSEKGDIFIERLRKKHYNNNIINSLQLLTYTPLYGEPNNYLNVLQKQRGLIGKVIASLPAYDFYMNWFFGKDISSYKNESGEIEPLYPSGSIEIKASQTNPKQLLRVFGSAMGSDYFTDINETAKSIKKAQIESMNDYHDIWKGIMHYIQNDFIFDNRIIGGKVVYILPIDDFRNIMNKHLHKIYLKRYVGKYKDKKNKIKVEGFNVKYILDKLTEIDDKVTPLLNSANDEDKEQVNKYIVEYYKLLLDYNLFLATLEKNNEFSIISMLNSTNIRLLDIFSNMSGHEIEIVLKEYDYYIEMLRK